MRHRDAPLPPTVGSRFQVLFHSPHRGSFHLSLTVLLRYRSSRVFSLGAWSPRLPTGLACPVVLRVACRPHAAFVYGTLTPFGGPSQTLRLAAWRRSAGALQPRPSGRFGLFPFRSPLLGESSLFLGVLRCFSSPGSPSYRRLIAVHGFGPVRVSPFGYPRFSACTRLPEAFRSVPRPSSALDAKASSVSLLLLSPFF
jgi:hypothetical protein